MHDQIAVSVNPSFFKKAADPAANFAMQAERFLANALLPTVYQDHG